MADPINLAQAQEQLDAFMAASKAIATGGQSYRIGDRQFTRADLAEVQRQISFWRSEVTAMAGSTGRRGPFMRGNRVA